MEIIRRSTDYGLRALAYMASEERDGPVQAGEIAAAEDLPEEYLQKLLRALSDAGIVTAHRGPAGGFSLARRAADVTLLDVMEVLQGPVAINKCLLGKNACPRAGICRIRNRWTGMQAQLVEFLSGMTLADVLEEGDSG